MALQRQHAESQVNKLLATLAGFIRANKDADVFMPPVVAAYAALTIQDDRGRPVAPAPHHWLWLRLACDERVKQLLIIAPPESAKTTWMVSAFLACRIGFYPESNVILASVNASTAEKRSIAVRTAVESEIWRYLFPKVDRAEGMKYEQAEWSIAPDGKPHPGRLHPTVRAYGTGESIVGSRADLLLGDDLLDMENTRTDNARKLVREWFHTSFLSRRKTGGRVILIGTAWNAADLYAEIRKEKIGWVVCHTPLLENGDGFYADITYPDEWPYEKIGEPIGEAALCGR